jgi:hypothetical protein
MKGQQNTKPVVWTFGQLRDALVGTAVDVQGSKYLVEVPRFQRGFVWKQSKQRKLIESVRDGYPIGALVMCRIGTKEIDGETATVFHLIDGLQRSVTIKDYLGAPLKWFEGIAKEVAPKALLEELLALLDTDSSKISVDELRNEISGWMEGIGSLDDRKLTQYSLWSHLNNTLLGGNSTQLSERAAEILQDIIVDAQRETAFEHHEIPVLLYSGDRAHTPEIFDLLNQQGQKLSTYQKLAAIWVKDEVYAPSINNRVDTFIKRRRASLAKDGYVLEGTVSISLFDYLNGYGHLLAAEHPGLFSARKEGEESPHGFYLAALCTHVRLTTKELKDLPKDLSTGEKLDLRSLEGIVEKGVALISDAIEPWLHFSIRSKKTQTGTADRPILTDLQVASLVSWAALRLSSGANVNRDLLVRALRRRIVAEVLDDTWKGGPVDSLAFTRVWAPGSTAKDRILNDAFERPLSDFDFEGLLDRWFKTQIEDRTGLRSSITDRQRLVLKLIAASSAKYFQQFAIFDIDHLIPVSTLRAAQKQETWPINCIANLGLLPESLNKEKADKTFYEWYAQPRKIEEPPHVYQDNRERAKATSAIEDPLLWDLSGFTSNQPLRFHDYERILREHWAHQKRLIIESVR